MHKMRKPCTDCPHFKKHHIPAHDGSRGSCSGTCMAGRLYGFPNVPVALGYYEMIANCVDYAEYLAWQRVNRKKKLKGE